MWVARDKKASWWASAPEQLEIETRPGPHGHRLAIGSRAMHALHRQCNTETRIKVASGEQATIFQRLHERWRLPPSPVALMSPTLRPRHTAEPSPHRLKPRCHSHGSPLNVSDQRPSADGGLDKPRILAFPAALTNTNHRKPVVSHSQARLSESRRIVPSVPQECVAASALDQPLGLATLRITVYPKGQ